MTRREWLHKNPPPKAAKELRALLERITQEEQARGTLDANRASFQSHLNYWQQQAQAARAASDTQAIDRKSTV